MGAEASRNGEGLAMRAVEIRESGGPDVLRLVERPRPVAGAGEVLIRVSAAGVNRPDLLQREGKYPPPSGVTDVPGLEIAGEIVATGAGVIEPRVGERVMALVAGGGYAEYCIAPAGSCLPVPSGVSMIEAAAIPETCFTVWANVFESGGLRPGETLLVHGGASGIGTMAIAMARAHGARPYATSRGAQKCAAIEKLGAVRCIDSERLDFVSELRDAGVGVDVILDILGGDVTHRNLQVLSPHGRLVQIATLLGSKAEINLSVVMQKRVTITGSTLRNRSVEEKARLAREISKNVIPWIDSGAVRPVIHMTFPLDGAARAHQQLEAGHHIGKIVLTID